MLLYLHCLSNYHQHMPRQERTKSGTGIYHVMLRGINKQDIFEDDEDYSQFLNILYALVNRCDETNISQISRITGISYGVIYRAKSGS